MRRISAIVLFAAAIAFAESPYKILKTAKAGGEGGFDYISADVDARRLYVPRSGEKGHLMVFNLDTLELIKDIPNIAAGGAAVDPRVGATDRCAGL